MDSDAEQLSSLGYSATFDRTMSAWENFSLGFTYLSPVVGVYTVFTVALVIGGPPMWWTYLLVGAGQMLVCLVFCEVVSQFPVSGGIYPWARRLVGKRWAWLAGWVYAWALFSSIAAVAIGSSPFVAALFQLHFDERVETVIAIGMITLVMLLNFCGTRLLSRVALFGFICELVGAIAVGGYLLIFARHQPLRELWNTHGLGGRYGYLSAFLGSAVAGLFLYGGFEACGDVAEETPNAGRTIPRTMRMTMYVGGASAMFVSLALILAVPDMTEVLTGQSSDPVGTILTDALGRFWFRILSVVLLISFVSCVLSLQAAASRLLFAYGRDQMIPGSRFLSRISPRTHVPIAALLMTGLIPGAIALCRLWLRDAIETVLLFGVSGIYIAFQMVVIGALTARLKGWKPSGAFQLRQWGYPVSAFALFYGIAALTDMVWPRNPQAPWFVDHAVMIAIAVVLIPGICYLFIAKPHDQGEGPAADAHLLHSRNVASACHPSPAQADG